MADITSQSLFSFLWNLRIPNLDISGAGWGWVLVKEGSQEEGFCWFLRVWGDGQKRFW